MRRGARAHGAPERVGPDPARRRRRRPRSSGALAAEAMPSSPRPSSKSASHRRPHAGAERRRVSARARTLGDRGIASSESEDRVSFQRACGARLSAGWCTGCGSTRPPRRGGRRCGSGLEVRAGCGRAGSVHGSASGGRFAGTGVRRGSSTSCPPELSFWTARRRRLISPVECGEAFEACSEALVSHRAAGRLRKEAASLLLHSCLLWFFGRDDAIVEGQSAVALLEDIPARS